MRYEIDDNKKIALANNPDYLHKVYPLVVELADIIKTPGMSAQSIFAYLLYGSAETWVALKENKPIGFAVFQELGPPHYSSGTCPFVYMQEKDKELIGQLYEKFTDFLIKHKLKYFSYHSQNKKLGEHFKGKLKEHDLETIKSEHLYIGKRKIGGK